jgi:hypothetical protein
MPHFGHFPGLFVTTSGCMTQVYLVAVADEEGFASWAVKGAAVRRETAAMK